MNAQVATRHLAWQECHNPRDLGGYQTATRAETRWHRVIRSDSLHRLTEAGEAALRACGISTMIDLRTDMEISQYPNAIVGRQGGSGSPTYLHLPILDGPPVMGQQYTNGIDAMVDLYSRMLDDCGDRFAAVVRALAQAAPGAVVFYCSYGKDRTGLVTALLLALADVPDETIAADYALSNHYLQPLYAEICHHASDGAASVSTDDWLLQSSPEIMLATLAHLEQTFGGVEAYLRYHGITSNEIRKIRRRLLA